MASGDERRSVASLETGQLYGTWRAAATFVLAGHRARSGRRADALALLERMTDESPYAVRGGSMRVALLRALGRTEDARRAGDGLAHGGSDQLDAEGRSRPGSACRPTRCGLTWPPTPNGSSRSSSTTCASVSTRMRSTCSSRRVPQGPGVVSEPGMPRPETYPLVAYYRGYCRHLMGQPAKADFDAASAMPTTYAFPHRPDTLPVLRRSNPTEPERRHRPLPARVAAAVGRTGRRGDEGVGGGAAPEPEVADASPEHRATRCCTPGLRPNARSRSCRRERSTTPPTSASTSDSSGR